MGRKRIPNDQRREVISISLKPTTISKIDDHISHETSRSQWIETIILKHLESTKSAIKEDTGPTIKADVFESQCQPCDLWFEGDNEWMMRAKYCNYCHKITEYKGLKTW